MSFHKAQTYLVLGLAVLVGVQMTGVLPCADDSCNVWHLVFDHEEDNKVVEDIHEDHTTDVDCLCHLIFPNGESLAVPDRTDIHFPALRGEPGIPPSIAPSVLTPPPRS